MRLLFREDKQIQFLEEAINLSNSGTIKNFADLISVKYGSLKNWLSNKRLLPKNVFDKIILYYPELKKYEKYILEVKDDFWGSRIGGKKTYSIILSKYGPDELERRRIKGIRNSIKSRNKNIRKFRIDFNTEMFLEFYGALLGDGWISIFNNKKYNKKYWLVGFSGHFKNDKSYLDRIRNITKTLFNRNGYIRNKPKSALEFTFGHKGLINLLHNELGFPIGLKTNLKINERFLNDWNSVKYIIRGLFDTDGSLTFDKDHRYKRPYPIIEITSYSRGLVQQIADALKKQNFRVIKNSKGIRIKGESQLKKWFEEIQPKNERHLLKYARVAQSG